MSKTTKYKWIHVKLKEFRADLIKIMPGYSWTVHRPPSEDVEKIVATGIQSSGSNRLSTLQIERRERDDGVSYLVRSAGYGRHAEWLHTNIDATLARALRGLQDHYERQAAKYRNHAEDLKIGRVAPAITPANGDSNG